MAKLVMEEYQEYPTLPPETILHLKVDGEPKTKDVPGRNEGSSWKKLEFKFKILGIQVTGDGSPAENYDALIGEAIWGSVPFRLNDSPDNKLKQWCEAIFQMALGVGFELDTELLDNKQVRGITSVYNKKNINPRTGQPFQQHQIESLLVLGGSVPPSSGVGQQAVDVGPLVAPPAAVQTGVQAPPAPQPLADPWGSAPDDPAMAGAPQNWGDEPPF